MNTNENTKSKSRIGTWLAIGAGALVLTIALVAGGFFIGRITTVQAAEAQVSYGPAMMQSVTGGAISDMGPSMMHDGGYGPSGDYGPGGYGHGHGYGPGMMGGEYSDAMHAAIAAALGISVEELETAMWDNGLSMWNIAAAQGFSDDEFVALMEDIHDSVLIQMVEDGVITQEQADWMSERMGGGAYGYGGCHGWQYDGTSNSGA